MARRRHHEEHENHERWLVSYADFITLLFAFFVVMYSISSINGGKYKVISEALVGVFTDSDRALRPIQIGDERAKTVTPAQPLVKDSDQLDAGIVKAADELLQAAPVVDRDEGPFDGDPIGSAHCPYFTFLLEMEMPSRAIRPTVSTSI